MTARAYVLILLLALAGCASSPVVLLNAPPAHTMADDELLSYYLRLRAAVGDTAAGIAGMQSQYGYDRVFGGPGQALGNLVIQAMMAGTGGALRERGIEVRVELERRGWTPALGFTRGMTQAGGGFPIAQPLPSVAQAGSPAITAQQVGVPVGAAPTIALGIKAESKWLVSAEGVARVEGCAPPNVAMTSKGAGQEMFAAACQNGTTLAIRCDVEGCRVLR